MSALESSITLEDVFSVVEAKRVPLAPELAGYLTLEVADGTQGTGGEVDPRTVYISEEGTVALVRPKNGPQTGDAETSVRGMLAKLLEASGSATPALSASARRKPGAGVPALVEELEAALIPVNRAAGRRALARLAREVKRVTLGVGRNASVPPLSRAPSAPAIAAPKREPEAPLDLPGPRATASSFSDEAITAKRPNQLADLASAMNAPEIVGGGAGAGSAGPKAAPLAGLTPPPVPGAPPPLPPPPARAGAAPLPPPPVKSGSNPPFVAPPPRRGGDAKAEGPDTLFGGDEVDSLLATFEVASVGEKQMARDLKAIAGLDPTPAPPDASTLEALTKDIGKDLPKSAPSEPLAGAGAGAGHAPGAAGSAPPPDAVEALLAMAEASGPLAPPLPPPGFPSKPQADLGEAPLIPPASVQRPASAGPPALPASAPAIPAAPTVPLAPAAAAPAMPAAAPPPPAPVRRPSPASVPLVAAVPPVEPSRRAAPAVPQAAPSGPASGGSPTGRHKKPPESAPPPATTARKSRPGVRSGSYRQPRAPRTGLVMLVLTLIVLGAGGAAIWMWKPAFFTGTKKRPVPSATASAALPVAQPPRCKVALVVTDAPANAEILLRMGQSPLDVERMPMGTRLEFVGTAEGYAPKRAVVKADAPWDKAPDGKPRIDVPLQLDPTKAKPGAVDPWPPAEPGSQVGGSGSPGTVHVVSNVRGAEVWLLAGLGPEARIEQLRCDADIDVLLAGPPQLRKRLHVGDKEIQAAAPDPQGNRVVTVSAK